MNELGPLGTVYGQRFELSQYGGTDAGWRGRKGGLKFCRQSFLARQILHQFLPKKKKKVNKLCTAVKICL